MARIAGVNIPTNKRVEVALTYIHGIGDTFAHIDVPPGEERRLAAAGKRAARVSR